MLSCRFLYTYFRKKFVTMLLVRSGVSPSNHVFSSTRLELETLFKGSELNTTQTNAMLVCELFL